MAPGRLIVVTNVLRIATRKSRLALWQAEHVRSLLAAAHPDLDIELLPFTTTGDRILDRPLAMIGGKGLFIKELEQALYDKRDDIAVHSMKDVPVEIPEGLHIPVILEREDPRDAIVTRGGVAFAALADGAIVGTSSLRRKSQLLARRADFAIRDLRGNVPTRLEKLHNGEFDAIVLACAGLKRLGFSDRIDSALDVGEMIPAVGQGAIGIECRVDDPRIAALIAPLHHDATALCVTAERAMSAYLAGGCDVPLAAHATLDGTQLHLRGLVANPDGRRVARDERSGPAAHGAELGRELGAALVAAGADEILAELERRQS